MKFPVFRDVKLWHVVLGVLKGHSLFIFIIKESTFLDFCPLTLKVKTL
jgi:hypothetical protein